MSPLEIRKYPMYLFIAFMIAWGISAIKPLYPSDFLLENFFTLIFIFLLVASYKKFPLSNLSYTLIFIFMILHIIGAHYTYAEVPYDKWLKNLFGFAINDTFGFSRNHYDRFVHFSFGLLLAYPIREIFLRIVDVRGFWGYYLPFDVTAAFSMIYELIEWAAALIFGGELGMAYLGTQGDVWDAHKDMALAILGAFISMLTVAVINNHYKKNFAKEISESFRVKIKKRLGEVRLRELKSKMKGKLMRKKKQF